VHNPNGKWISLAVFAQLTAEVPVLNNGHPYPPEWPLHMDRHLSKPKEHVDWFSRFYTADCRMSLYFTMIRPFLLNIAHSHGGFWTPWFLLSSTQMATQSLNLFCRAR